MATKPNKYFIDAHGKHDGYHPKVKCVWQGNSVIAAMWAFYKLRHAYSCLWLRRGVMY